MKYLVLLDDLADEVPMPYRLFSHTKTQGRDQTVSISVSTSDSERKEMELTLGHVVGLEYLALVGGSVSIHGESSVILVLSEVGLRECDTSSQGNLSSNDTVSSEESTSFSVSLQDDGWEERSVRWREDVPMNRISDQSLSQIKGLQNSHRTTLSTRHTIHPT